MRQDRRFTIRIIADELNINECTVHQIVTQDLNMRKLRAKMVPNEVSAEMLERIETGPDFLTRAVTGDERWFFESGGTRHNLKDRKLEIKTMVTIFIDSRG
jgi:hypothetical protein